MFPEITVDNRCNRNFAIITLDAFNIATLVALDGKDVLNYLLELIRHYIMD